MTSVQFCYWLQGFFELGDVGPSGAHYALTEAQVKLVRAHLAMVFKHEIDPSYPNGEELSKIHESGKTEQSGDPAPAAPVEHLTKDDVAKEVKRVISGMDLRDPRSIPVRC